MDFPSRKSILKGGVVEGAGRKRLREESSSDATPPAKVSVSEAAKKITSIEAFPVVVPVEITAPVPVTTPLAVPTTGTAGGDPLEQIAPSPGKPRTGTELDLELSLRQKKTHDINASGEVKSTEANVDMPEELKKIDLAKGDGDTAKFEFRARGDRGRCGTSDSVERGRVDDTVSSSGTGVYGFITVPSDSGLKVSDSGNHVEINKAHEIPPANQNMTFYESAEMHGLDLNTGMSQHDKGKGVEIYQPTNLPRSPPRGRDNLTLEGPGGSSTPAPDLAQKQICEKMLQGVEEIKKMMCQLHGIEEIKETLRRLVDIQATLGASADLAGGMVTDLRNYVSRIPNRSTMNVTFCGLMVAARLGHLNPFIFEDPVILCLLGDHAEDVRQMIEGSPPYPYSCRGPQ